MTEILSQLFKYAEDKLGMRNLLLIVALICAAIYLLTWPKEDDQEVDDVDDPTDDEIREHYTDSAQTTEGQTGV